MEVKEVMIHGDYAAFWGGVFSNWYPCKFKAYGKTWYSSEQFFMWLKAEYFDDEETALAITKTMSASVAKQLGREVKNFDETKWQAVRYEFCRRKSCRYHLGNWHQMDKANHCRQEQLERGKPAWTGS